MTYFDPRLMEPHKHEALLAWLQGEGLVPSNISSESFSVHDGQISGYMLLRDDEGNLKRRHGEVVKIHFTQKQIHPLPPELT